MAADSRQEVGRDREWRARPEDDTGHGAPVGVMVLADHPHAVLEDGGLVLHTVVGREATSRFAQGHRSPAGVEPDADLGRCRDLVVDPASVLEHVGVIEDRRAARQRELGQPNQRAPVGGLRGPLGPDLVVGPQPGEQVDVLAQREVAGEGLVEVVVRVDHPGQHDLAAQVEDRVGLRGEILRRTDRSDHAVLHQDCAVGYFAALVVHGDEDLCVAREEGGHGTAPFIGTTPTDGTSRVGSLLWDPTRPRAKVQPLRVRRPS